MPRLNAGDQARLETALANAWRYLFAASQLQHARGQDHEGDDLVDMSFSCRRMLEAELKKGRTLRTRPHNCA